MVCSYVLSGEVCSTVIAEGQSTYELRKITASENHITHDECHHKHLLLANRIHPLIWPVGCCTHSLALVGCVINYNNHFTLHPHIVWGL